MKNNNEVKTVCKYCRREFNSVSLKKICPECDANMEDYFKRIKAYINEFPDATISDVCENLDVPPALIKFYLKEDRLLIKNNDNNYFLRCVSCNKPISSGRYCFECEINATRNEMKGTMVNKEETQMHSDIAKFHSGRSKKIGGGKNI